MKKDTYHIQIVETAVGVSYQIWSDTYNYCITTLHGTSSGMIALIAVENLNNNEFQSYGWTNRLNNLIRSYSSR